VPRREAPSSRRELAQAAATAGRGAYTYDLANKLAGTDAANDATSRSTPSGGSGRRPLTTASGTDTYSHAGTGETVVRIANTISGTTVDTWVGEQIRGTAQNPAMVLRPRAYRGTLYS
jgi:hypothetical protein